MGALLHAFLAVTVLGLALAAVLVGNSVRRRSRQVAVPPAPPLALDMRGAAERLAGAIRIETVSRDHRPPDRELLLRLHDYLERHFPGVHQSLKRETVNGGSLLYTWQGTDPGAAQVLLAAHQDVVPIAPGTEDQWSHPPFGGVVADGFVWGRGAMDDKGNLLGMLEAVELLLAEGFRPRRTLYLAFGHDEEILGQEGARMIARILKERGVRLEYVLDEGVIVTKGMVAGVSAPLAMVGVTEKGYMTLRLSTRAVGAHASMPQRRTAIGALTAGLARLLREPMPSRLHPVVREMFETLAPECGWMKRLFLSNLWLFWPFVRRQLEASQSSAPALRTTAAPTVVRAGEKSNVLPVHAEAHVNFRLLEGDAARRVVEHVRGVIADDTIEVETDPLASEATPVSRTDAPAYAQIQRAVREVIPGALVAPSLFYGTTDSRFYADIADDVYRFSPLRIGPDDTSRPHGTDERLSLANYEEMIRFYHRLLGASLASGPLAPLAPSKGSRQ